MIRARFLALFSIALFATATFAQEKVFIFDQTGASDTLQAPDQLRRAAPPSKTASAAELEDQGDQLRAKKNFADALDYYRAAIKKHDTPVLENKAGLSEMSLFHLNEAQHRFDK